MNPLSKGIITRCINPALRSRHNLISRGFKDFGHKPQPVNLFTKITYPILFLSPIALILDWKWLHWKFVEPWWPFKDKEKVK